MTEERTENQTAVTRRGFPVWSYNPSVTDVRLKRKDKPIKLERGQNVMLVNDHHQILGEGTVGFWRREVVDDERFMKVFIGQLDRMFELTKTGQRVLKIIWGQLHDNKDQDKVELKPMLAKMQDSGISERVFQKGVRELLEKGFIFMSPIDGVYYINMGIFFNGNRIVTAVEYIREGTQEQLPLQPPLAQLSDETEVA